MSEPKTFRDFASALADGDDAAAAGVLTELLGLDGAGAAKATAHFRAQLDASPQFMMKAMGMRGVVEARDVERLRALLEECFGLPDGQAAASVLLARYA
jgi:hypothetical protein